MSIRSGSVTPEIVLGLAALVLVLLASFELARGVAAVWGVQRAAEAGLQEIRLRGPYALPEAVARDALAGTPFLPLDPYGPGVTVTSDPPDAHQWRFGRRVCLSVLADWEMGGGLLPHRTISLSATRCGFVEHWPP